MCLFSYFDVSSTVQWRAAAKEKTCQQTGWGFKFVIASSCRDEHFVSRVEQVNKLVTDLKNLPFRYIFTKRTRSQARSNYTYCMSYYRLRCQKETTLHEKLWKKGYIFHLFFIRQCHLSVAQKLHLYQRVALVLVSTKSTSQQK